VIAGIFFERGDRRLQRLGEAPLAAGRDDTLLGEMAAKAVYELRVLLDQKIRRRLV